MNFSFLLCHKSSIFKNFLIWKSKGPWGQTLVSLDVHVYVCSSRPWLNIPHTYKSQESVGLVYFMQASFWGYSGKNSEESHMHWSWSCKIWPVKWCWDRNLNSLFSFLLSIFEASVSYLSVNVIVTWGAKFGLRGLSPGDSNWLGLVCAIGPLVILRIKQMGKHKRKRKIRYKFTWKGITGIGNRVDEVLQFQKAPKKGLCASRCGWWGWGRQSLRGS